MKRRPDKRRRLLLRWTALGVAVTTVLTVLLAMVSSPRGEVVPAAGSDVAGLTSVLSKSTGDARTPIRFRDVTDVLGIDFHHMPAPRQSLLPEDMGSGVAVGDYDGDGWPDLYFVNFAGNVVASDSDTARPRSDSDGSGPPDSTQPVDAGSPPGTAFSKLAGRSRLYRNANGRLFEDVTDDAGVGFIGYGMGACWGDYDGDADLDLYVTAYGRNALYRNNGDGTFSDVTEDAGVGDARFSAGCSWADYDRDGHLDLYVCNYVDFVYRQRDRHAVNRQYETEQPYTLNPSSYPPQPNSLFHNNGNGTFTDVAVRAGVADPQGRSLSASWANLNNDRFPDLYVANDVSNNGVFLNRGDGTFADVGASSMAADYRGAMGIAVADFDNDLDLDLFVTHWIAQENALYRNMYRDPLLAAEQAGRLWFMDEAEPHGLGQISLDMVGWAAGFADFDNDGRRDLWVINGSTLESRTSVPDARALSSEASDSNGSKADTSSRGRPLEPQRPQLFWNRPGRMQGQRQRSGSAAPRVSGPAEFVEITAGAARALAEPVVGRGGAVLDYNRDGRLDLVVVRHGGQPRVFENVSEPAGHWLRIRLTRRRGNRFAVGARVYVEAGGVTQMAEPGSSSSYLSQDEATLHFGLGSAGVIDEVRIIWPDGLEHVERTVRPNQELSVLRSENRMVVETVSAPSS